MPSLLVRERPPLRLHASISTPAGAYYRWGPDAHQAQRVASGLSFSTVMPGGFDQANLVLARDPSLEYSDLEELSTVTIRGAGGRIAWQGRMESSPRSSGEQMSISPGLVGWQAHLADNTSARMIYVDIDLSKWQGSSNQRHINMVNAAIDSDDGTTGPDWTTGKPALVTGWSSSWTRTHDSELWYDAKGLALKSISLVTTPNANTNPVDPNWSWQAYLLNDDVASAYDPSANYSAAGAVAHSLAATTNTRRWALVGLQYIGPAGQDGVAYGVYWTQVAVFGYHNVAYVASGDVATSGMLASDIEADVLSRWAPRLKYTTGANGSIRASAFLVPQATYIDPTTAAAIIKDVNQYELRDWAVWEGPTYYSNPFNGRGNTWQVRVNDAKLQETGPQASRLFNGVIVTYTDVTGIARSVGPIGSGASTEDGSLSDTDPLNPANQLGIRKWGTLQMQTAVAASAIKVGAQFLQYQKLLNTSGQANLVGHVMDMNGNWWPAYMVRAGDQISFVDAGDFSFRRVVSTSYDDTSKTNSIQLDAPPDGLQALLERISAQLVPGGFS